jgi:hypothetical protein
MLFNMSSAKSFTLLSVARLDISEWDGYDEHMECKPVGWGRASRGGPGQSP